MDGWIYPECFFVCLRVSDGDDGGSGLLLCVCC